MYWEQLCMEVVVDTLKGLTVLDLTQVVSGAVATMLMAEAGADVIKIEPPTGEAYRNAGFPIENESGTTNLNIMRFTRGKRSVTLDLKTSEGKELFRSLVSQADILAENFRPGALTRLGFSPSQLRDLNPGLIYTTVSGFGHDDLYPSLYKELPAYAIVTEAMAGLMHLAGDSEGPPVWMGFAMSDIFAGVLAYAGTLMALLERNQKPSGQRVDVAMYDGALLMNDLAIAAYSVMKEVMGGGQYLLQSPWGPFRTTDGYVVIAVLSNKEWDALCAMIGRADLLNDQRLRDGLGRSKFHAEIVEPAITSWTGARSKLQAAAALAEAGVPAAPVRDASEVSACEHAKARDMLIEVDDPVFGPVQLVGNPIKMGSSPPRLLRQVARLGEHTYEVLREQLGLDQSELEQLTDAGVITDVLS